MRLQRQHEERKRGEQGRETVRGFQGRRQTVSSSVGPSCQHFGGVGGDLFSLHAPILFSGFPFHEEIVVSCVMLPFKAKGKCAYVFKCKGINKNPIHPPQIPQTIPKTHTTVFTAGEKSLRTCLVLSSFLIAPRKVALLKNGKACRI